MTQITTHSTPEKSIIALLAMLAIVSLACSTGGPSSPAGQGGGYKFGFEQGKAESEDGTTPENTPGSYVPRSETEASTTQAEPEEPDAPAEPALQGARHDLGTIPAPTLDTILRARKAGLPPVTEAQKIAGPFDGPRKSVFYMNGEGLVSFYLPEYHAAYFAQAKPFRWIYGVSMAGYFAFDQNNNYLELAQAPEQLLAWPMAYPIAEQIAEFAHAYIEEQRRVEQGAAPGDLRHRNLDELSEDEQKIFWDAMSQTATLMNETTMAVIANIGGAGCVSHYQDEHFMGCY